MRKVEKKQLFTGGFFYVDNFLDFYCQYVIYQIGGGTFKVIHNKQF